jgi:hypothetical protein
VQGQAVIVAIDCGQTVVGLSVGNDVVFVLTERAVHVVRPSTLFA